MGTGTLMNTVLKESLTPSSVVIPPESIQAAYASVFKDALGNRLISQLSDEGFLIEDVIGNNSAKDLVIKELGLKPDDLLELQSVVDSLTTPEVAKRFGLPEESLSKYLDENQLNPQKHLEDWIGAEAKSGDAYDGYLPFSKEDSEMNTDWSDLFKGKNDDWWNNLKSLEEDDDVEGGILDEIPYMVKSYFQDPYHKLLGEENFNQLSSQHGSLNNLMETSLGSMEQYGLDESVIDQILQELSRRE
jgi:hypothetical protein